MDTWEVKNVRMAGSAATCPTRRTAEHSGDGLQCPSGDVRRAGRRFPPRRAGTECAFDLEPFEVLVFDAAPK